MRAKNNFGAAIDEWHIFPTYTSVDRTVEHVYERDSLIIIVAVRHSSTLSGFLALFR